MCAAREKKVTSDGNPAGPIVTLTPSRHTLSWGLLAILFMAGLLRVVYQVQYADQIPTFSVPIIDSAYYDQWARRVASGQGYGESPYYLAPLYPYFLAGLYVVFGPWYVPVYVIQSILGLVNLALVYVLGRRLFGHRPALAATALMALYAPPMLTETKLLSETLGITLTLAALVLVVRAFARGRIVEFLPAGLVVGLSALCRSANLLFGLALLVWLAAQAAWTRDRTRIGALAATGVGLAIAILPVTARNYFGGHDRVLVATNAGMTFAQGNNEKARGIIARPPGTTQGIAGQQQEEMAIAERELGHPVKPSEASRYWFRRGLSYIRENPFAYLELLGRKIVLSFTNREEQDSFEVYYEIARLPLLRLLIVPFSIIAGLALIGLGAGRGTCDRSSAGLLVMYTATVLLTLLIFYVAPRYRLPAMPVLAVFAGYGLVWTVARIRRRALAPASLALAVLVGTTIVGQLPYPIEKGQGAFVLGNVARRYQEQGDTDRQITLLREALRVSPSALEIHGELAMALERKGAFAEAAEHYRTALKSYPDATPLHLGLARVLQRLGDPGSTEQWSEALRQARDPARVHANHGAQLLSQGKIEEAVKEFAAAVACEPQSSVMRNNLGFALLRADRPDEALEELTEAVRLDPAYARARSNFALALTRRGQPDDAITQYREALRLDPKLVPIRYDLARLLAQTGKIEEAAAEFQEVLRLDPRHPYARRELDALPARPEP